MADDVTQETFLRLYKKYEMYNDDKPIRPWLYRVTLNVTRNLLRKQKWLSFTDKVPDIETANSPEDGLIQNEASTDLWQRMEQISYKSREVLILHFYVGLTLEETAHSLGIPVGTCKSRLNTALNALRRQYSANPFAMDV